MTLLFKSQLNDSSQIQNQYTSYFQRIRIVDATIFQVPNHLAPIYPGSGKCAQTAGIKIQLEYDLHSGKFLNFQMEPGKNNDKTFGTDCLDTLCPGDTYEIRKAYIGQQKFPFICLTSYRKTDENPIDMRKKQSLIF
ncbi:hypothetical protein BAGA_24535 [Bacillus gaemokensis]|uniref:Transposase IS4-like domain-containing protein n=1 Tax=Bacillus gaemokensis TaxID=574375 RepID=A0A073K3J8_9BACI|nr:hypothetical protein BAGA_24535 [Bacillus gaemokensis]